MSDEGSVWTGGRGRPNPHCVVCRQPQEFSDGTLVPGEACPRHSYDPARSVDADPDGMGSADMWQEWP